MYAGRSNEVENVGMTSWTVRTWLWLYARLRMKNAYELCIMIESVASRLCILYSYGV